MTKGNLIADLGAIDLGDDWELSFELQLESGSGNIINLVNWHPNIENGWQILFDLDADFVPVGTGNALLKYAVNKVHNSSLDDIQINVTTIEWNKYCINCSAGHCQVSYPTGHGIKSDTHHIGNASFDLDHLRLYVGDPWSSSTPVAYLQNIMLTDTVGLGESNVK